jgi:hypothetical protein
MSRDFWSILELKYRWIFRRSLGRKYASNRPENALKVVTYNLKP